MMYGAVGGDSMATVYIIRNTEDDRVYIGSTKQPLHKRLNEHRSRARRNNKRYYFYHVMREIGPEKFFIEPLQENIPDEELLNAEQEYIKGFNPVDMLLNTKYGISYSDMDYIVSEYKAGKKIKEISAERHHDAKNVSKVLRERGIEVTDWNEVQRIKIDNDDLRRMYLDELMTTPEIAEKYGTSAITINKHLRRIGIPLRKAVNRKYLKLPRRPETDGQ